MTSSSSHSHLLSFIYAAPALAGDSDQVVAPAVAGDGDQV
jgi:hypothetical protein